MVMATKHTPNQVSSRSYGLWYKVLQVGQSDAAAVHQSRVPPPVAVESVFSLVYECWLRNRNLLLVWWWLTFQLQLLPLSVFKNSRHLVFSFFQPFLSCGLKCCRHQTNSAKHFFSVARHSSIWLLDGEANMLVVLRCL